MFLLQKEKEMLIRDACDYVTYQNHVKDEYTWLRGNYINTPQIHKYTVFTQDTQDSVYRGRIRLPRL